MKRNKFKNYQDDFEDEVWAQYSDFTNYKISTYGRIKKVSTGRIKAYKEPLNCKSYKATTMIKDQKSYGFKMHVLVLLTFVSERPKGMFACHINGNLRDNRLVNLKWATQKENYMDAIEHGTMIHNKRAVLSDSDALEIRSYISHRGLIKKLADYYQVSAGVIYGIRNRKTYTHLP